MLDMLTSIPHASFDLLASCGAFGAILGRNGVILRQPGQIPLLRPTIMPPLISTRQFCCNFVSEMYNNSKDKLLVMVLVFVLPEFPYCIGSRIFSGIRFHVEIHVNQHTRIKISDFGVYLPVLTGIPPLLAEPPSVALHTTRRPTTLSKTTNDD
jgi:hypothetical protein